MRDHGRQSCLRSRPRPGVVADVERRLYLLRHGESANVTDDGRLLSDSPTPLSERGRRQIQALHELFVGLEFSTVYCSDMARAVETATGLAADRWVEPCPGFREISLGELDGALATEIFAACPGWLCEADARLPGGETLLEVGERASETLAGILAEDHERTVVVVAHGGLNRALLGRLLDLPIEAALRFRQDWACVNVLDYAGGRWHLGSINWTPCGVREFDYTRTVDVLGDEQWRRLGR